MICSPLHDFLFEVERDVSGEVFVGFVGEPYSGEKSVVDCAIQIEGVAKFGSGERMDVPHSRPAAEEVHAAVAELSRAGAGKQKLQSLGFYDTMDFIQQGRHLLDFVDYDRARLAADFFNVIGVSCNEGECFTGEQIEHVCVPKRLSNERGFSALPGSEKEARLVFQHGCDVDFSSYVHNKSFFVDELSGIISFEPLPHQMQIANSVGEFAAKSPARSAVCKDVLKTFIKRRTLYQAPVKYSSSTLQKSKIAGCKKFRYHTKEAA